MPTNMIGEDKCSEVLGVAREFLHYRDQESLQHKTFEFIRTIDRRAVKNLQTAKLSVIVPTEVGPIPLGFGMTDEDWESFEHERQSNNLTEINHSRLTEIFKTSTNNNAIAAWLDCMNKRKGLMLLDEEVGRDRRVWQLSYFQDRGMDPSIVIESIKITYDGSEHQMITQPLTLNHTNDHIVDFPNTDPEKDVWLDVVYRTASGTNTFIKRYPGHVPAPVSWKATARLNGVLAPWEARNYEYGIVLSVNGKVREEITTTSSVSVVQLGVQECNYGYPNNRLVVEVEYKVPLAVRSGRPTKDVLYDGTFQQASQGHRSQERTTNVFPSPPNGGIFHCQLNYDITCEQVA
jgi:hypothetical protein